MNHENGIKNISGIRSKSFTAINDDGLYFLFYGLLTAIVALLFLYENFLYIFIAVPVTILYKYARIKITYPRMGYADFKSNQSIRQMTLIGLLGCFLIAKAIFDPLPESILLPLFWGLSIGAGFLIIGILNRDKSWLLASMFYFFTIPIGIFANAGHSLNNTGLQLLAASALLTVQGTILLNRFLNKYPRPDRETIHAP